MKTVAIIQARMTSTRFPGKVMAVLGDRPILAHVIERALRIRNCDEVVVASPASHESKLLFDLATKLGVPFVYGSENDVLGRYFVAAEKHEADVIARITADCPLIDPEVCAQIIELRRRENADYASNVHPRSYPKGLDCEVFTFEKLRRANQNATEDYDREHVTPWIIRNSARVNYPSGIFNISELRWTVDYEEDLVFLRVLCKDGIPQTLNDALIALSKNPKAAKINANVERAA